MPNWSAALSQIANHKNRNEREDGAGAALPLAALANELLTFCCAAFCARRRRTEKKGGETGLGISRKSVDIAGFRVDKNIKTRHNRGVAWRHDKYPFIVFLFPLLYRFSRILIELFLIKLFPSRRHLAGGAFSLGVLPALCRLLFVCLRYRAFLQRTIIQSAV